MKTELTLEGAIEASRSGLIEEWVLAFLDADERSLNLAPALRKQTNYWVGPIEYSLSKLTRVAGPEEDMMYKKPKEEFNKRVKKAMDGIKDGWNPPPLLATDFWGGIHISDGNHRLEALKRSGREKYWIIFTSQTEEGIQKFLKTLED